MPPATKTKRRRPSSRLLPAAGAGGAPARARLSLSLFVSVALLSLVVAASSSSEITEQVRSGVRTRGGSASSCSSRRKKNATEKRDTKKMPLPFIFVVPLTETGKKDRNWKK